MKWEFHFASMHVYHFFKKCRFSFFIRLVLIQRLSIERDKVKVILIGHSLGAGAAVIAGMELREHDFLDVEVVGFGCPSLLSRDLSESTKDYITTVVNDADIVSRMSGASMTNILLDLMDYDWTQDALEDLEFSLERARESFPDFASFFPDTQKALEWFETRLNEVVRPNLLQRKNTQQTERLPSVLIPPGTCIHLFRDGYGVTGTYTPCDFFSSVEFSLTLLDDHLIPTGYNRALLAAAQDTDRDYSVSSIKRSEAKGLLIYRLNAVFPTMYTNRVYACLFSFLVYIFSSNSHMT